MHLKVKIVSTSGTQVDIEQAEKKLDFSFGKKKKREQIDLGFLKMGRKGGEEFVRREI